MAGKIRILHLSSERSWRGGEQQIAYLIDELTDNHNVINFVACRKKSAFEQHCKDHGIKNFTLPFANEFDIYTAWKVRSICKKENIDIVHIHSGHSHAIAVWSSILGNSSKLILSRRVDFPIKRNWFSRFKYNYRGIAKIICVSEAIQKIMEQDLKDPRKCLTIHSGIDLNRFQNIEVSPVTIQEELKIPKDQKIVANISAIAPHKDYFTFVDTAEKVIKKRKNTTFLIVGEGPEKAYIARYISEKKLQNKIILTGFRRDVPNLFRQIDALLITSKTEGLGTTILDAFANKVPVIATNAGGIPEAIEHKITGMLSEVGDSDNLAHNIIEILEDETLTKVLTENGYTKLKEHFTKQTTAFRTFQVYQKCLK